MFWLTLHDSAPRLTRLRAGDRISILRTGRRSVVVSMWRDMTLDEVRAFTYMRVERGRRERLLMGPSPQALSIHLEHLPHVRVIDGVLRALAPRLPELTTFTWRRCGRLPILLLSEAFIAV